MYCSVAEKTFYGAHQKNLNEDRPILWAAKTVSQIFHVRHFRWTVKKIFCFAHHLRFSWRHDLFILFWCKCSWLVVELWRCQGVIWMVRYLDGRTWQVCVAERYIHGYNMHAGCCHNRQSRLWCYTATFEYLSLTLIWFWGSGIFRILSVNYL